jgi:hypothetical protein
MQCPECGNTIDDNLKMCPSCHTPLTFQDAPTTPYDKSFVHPSYDADGTPIWPVTTEHPSTSPATSLLYSWKLWMAATFTVVGLSLLAIAVVLASSNHPISSVNNILPKATSPATPGITITPTIEETPTTPAGTSLIAVNCGGNASENFIADSGAKGGIVSQTNNPIETDGVENPAPQNVYQTERHGDFTYTFRGLQTKASYLVRLHFAEIYWTRTGQRIFSVQINNHTVLSNFDIIKEAGGPNRAIVREFSAQADGSGHISIRFRQGSENNPKCSGIEIQQSA